MRAFTSLAAAVAMLTAVDCAHCGLSIPQIAIESQRPVTIDDVLALRRVDSLSIAPDRRRFAIFVHQADPDINEYRTGWFIGDSHGGALLPVGDGGHIGPDDGGTIVGRESHWSPDGRWIAYALERHREVQLWRSRGDGAVQEQLTHNAADVLEIAWAEDGKALFFTTGRSRVELAAQEQVKNRAGYRYDDDLYLFTQFMTPPWPQPIQASPKLWIFDIENRKERPANDIERAAFERLRLKQIAGGAPMEGAAHDAAVPPVARVDGALVWLKRTKPASFFLRVMASLPPKGSSPIECTAEECSGFIPQVWWREDGKRVLFFRRAGVDFSSYEFYSWSPSDGRVSAILRAPDDDFRNCALAEGDRLLCVRETATRPVHVAAIDLRSGAVTAVGEVNPEFRNIRLGRIERLEWNTPEFEWNQPGGKLAGLYPKRAYGYILYPPDFDPTKRYPVFIDPYYSKGFESSLGYEHAQHVYAANGFVVLKTTFPSPIDPFARLGSAAMKLSYSAELDFPHLSMYAGSTLRALDTAAARGFIDEHRVGIGGVSHGSFVPMYMMQKFDRITASSLSSPGWGAHEYYAQTRLSREQARGNGAAAQEEWEPKPQGAGAEFYRRIDLADHIDAVEAPILMNLAAHESYGVVRLLRYLSDADKAYDAYLFPQETHVKWQPAHLRAIQERNLDWFRFWLQEAIDPTPAKADQYERWAQLRKRQCRNPRSLRDFCGTGADLHGGAGTSMNLN